MKTFESVTFIFIILVWGVANIYMTYQDGKKAGCRDLIERINKENPGHWAGFTTDIWCK